MRKLPVYLLLDTSGSMSGDPIESVKNGVQMLVSSLRQDPYALETAWLSVITFDSTAKQLVPLTELTNFQLPSISSQGTTSLGDALKLVAERADVEITKQTAEQKGDWKPMVFILTDGMPTDDWEKGLTRFRQRNWGITVGCAMDQGDTDVLKKICGEAVIKLSSSDASSISAFFKWVSASMSTASQKLETNKKDVGGLDDLPPPPSGIVIVV